MPPYYPKPKILKNNNGEFIFAYFPKSKLVLNKREKGLYKFDWETSESDDDMIINEPYIGRGLIVKKYKEKLETIKNINNFMVECDNEQVYIDDEEIKKGVKERVWTTKEIDNVIDIWIALMWKDVDKKNKPILSMYFHHEEPK